MNTHEPTPDYKGYRFPPEIISHAVWLYFRFSLSFRYGRRAAGESRGVMVTYETVRQWCLTFGQTYANELRCRRPRCGDKWHLGRGSSSRFRGRGTTSGELWIRTEMCLISWYRADATKRLRRDFS